VPTDGTGRQSGLSRNIVAMSQYVLGRFSRLFAALVLLSLAAIWLIFAGISYASYRSEWNAASLVANNVAVLLERDIARNIEMYDLSIRAAVKGLADPKVSALPEEARRDVLFDSSAMASGLGSILVLDTNGTLVMDSRNANPKSVSLADRDYFLAQRDGVPGDGLYISRPFQSRVYVGEWSVAVSRRRVDSAGKFAGVVVGSVRLSYFLSLFNDVRLPPDSSVTLFDKSGKVIVRAPFDRDQIGEDAAAAADFKQFGRPSGEFVAADTVDGVRRLFVYRQVGALPITQSVGLSVDRFLVEWRFRLAILATAFLILSALIGVLGMTLRKELRRRSEAERALSELATTDGLTQLTNRRRFDEVLDVEWRRCARAAEPLSLLMIDCDFFKSFNDAYGHLAGDAGLRAVADAIKGAISRPGDLAARFGGEEFVVLLPSTDRKGASVVAHAIRARIMALAIPHAKNPLGFITVSVGVASASPTADTAATALLQAADIALYQAKSNGRNTVASVDIPAVPREPEAAPLRHAGLTR
jgi:diguanylate cyclase (GGDEF)-like protein